jgi:predicted nucleic acid-binding protein
MSVTSIQPLQRGTLGVGSQKFFAVIDDRAARDCAYSMNIRVRGTIGIVLLAKRKNKIDRIAPVLMQLREAGLRVSQILFDEALRLAGEDK